MRKLDFEVAMRSLGLTAREGVYDSNGEQCDLFCWQDYCFYHAEGNRVFIAGKFPLPLKYQIYQTLSGNDGFKPEGDSREWTIKGFTADNEELFPKEKYAESISKGFNSTYSVTQIENFFEIIILIENYRRSLIGIKPLDDEKVEEYCHDVEMTTQEISESRLDDVAKGRRISSNENRTSENWLLKIELQYLDSVINPLQGGRFTLDTYENYSQNVAISIDHVTKTEMRVVYTPKDNAGITLYETSDEHVIYDSTRMTDDIYFKRIRHMNTEYKKGEHMSGEIIEVLTGLNIGISSFEIPKTEQPSFDFIYNVSENVIYANGEWRQATKEDIIRIIDEITDAINMTAKTTVEQMIKPGTKLSFAPID